MVEDVNATKGLVFKLRMSAELKRRLARLAAKKQRSMANTLNFLLNEAYEEEFSDELVPPKTDGAMSDRQKASFSRAEPE